MQLVGDIVDLIEFKFCPNVFYAGDSAMTPGKIYSHGKLNQGGYPFFINM